MFRTPFASVSLNALFHPSHRPHRAPTLEPRTRPLAPLAHWRRTSTPTPNSKPSRLLQPLRSALRRSASLTALALLASASLLATNNSASANVVFAGQADFDWAAAPGSVVEYGVWVVPEGGAPAAAPTFRVSGNGTTIAGQFGEAVQVVVAAYYDGDVLGPFSAPSQTIYFRAPLPAPYDVNGDGRVDRTLRDTLTGDVHLHTVDGLNALVEAELLVPNPRHLSVSGSADFDGDGKADLVMTNGSAGIAELWLLDGATVRAKLPIATLGPNWSARALGDIDADGTARLLWYKSTTGESQLWSMRNAQVVAQQPLLDMPSNWELSANCDIDGNGFRDLVWVDLSASAARIWMFDAAGAVDEVDVRHPGSKWWLQTCGDFERDGTDSLVWQRGKRIRLWSHSRVDAATATAVGGMRSIGAPGGRWASQAADFDADGDADLLFTNQSGDSLTTHLLEADQLTGDQRTPLASPARWSVSSW